MTKPIFFAVGQEYFGIGWVDRYCPTLGGRTALKY